MKIISDSHNVLLHRHDIVAKKSYSVNPGYKVVMEDIAKHFGKNADCIVIKSVEGGFGSSEFVIKARIYDSADKLQAIEPKPKVKKVEGAA